MSIRALLDGSERLLRTAAELAPQAEDGVRMLALALGRACTSPVQLDAMIELARTANMHEPEPSNG